MSTYIWRISWPDTASKGSISPLFLLSLGRRSVREGQTRFPLFLMVGKKQETWKRAGKCRRDFNVLLVKNDEDSLSEAKIADNLATISTKSFLFHFHGSAGPQRPCNRLLQAIRRVERASGAPHPFIECIKATMLISSYHENQKCRWEVTCLYFSKTHSIREGV